MNRSLRYRQTRQAWVEAVREVSCGSGAGDVDAFCLSDEPFVFPAKPFIVRELKAKMGGKEAENKKTEQIYTKHNNCGGNERSRGLTEEGHLAASTLLFRFVPVLLVPLQQSEGLYCLAKAHVIRKTTPQLILLQ